MTTPLYKVMTEAEWAAFERGGAHPGSELDREDGFVHLSAPDQVAGTVARYFAGRTGLVALAIDTSTMGKALKWETSPHGCYPHFYGKLTHDMVISADPIPDEPDARALAMALMSV